MKTYLLPFVYGFLSFAFLLLPAIASADDIALSIGRSANWPVAKSGEISVSNGAIIRVIDQGPSVKITALKLGTAVVRSGDRSLEVNVLPEGVYRHYASLREAMTGQRGLSLSSASGTLRVVGRLLRADDWMTLGSAMQSAEPGRYSFQASIEPETESAVRKSLMARLSDAGLSQTLLRFSPEAVATVDDAKESRARAEKVLSPFGIRVETSNRVVSLEPMVRVKIIVAEVRRSFHQKTGLSWSSSLGASLLPTLGFAGEPFGVSLEMLEERGWGRVLASPTLLCRSGKEASFTAGGEFPIKLTSISSSGVVWKSYGILLKVKPLADASGRMSIAIETEVSNIDDAHSVDGTPGLLTNRMQTHFDLTSSRTIALSGLIKNDESRKTSGIPGLSSIPILGSLFSSNEFKDNKSELMIFVTPAVSRPDDADLEAHP